jgi:hypothetical protein
MKAFGGENNRALVARPLQGERRGETSERVWRMITRQKREYRREIVCFD